jgi:hypothetical protein
VRASTMKFGRSFRCSFAMRSFDHAYGESGAPG